MTKRQGDVMEQADMLYRTAAECHRQHARHARLVQRGASDEEQRNALEAAYLCDDLLGTAITGYEKATSRAPARPTDVWWQKGNMLWHASREYIRRHADCEGIAKRLGKGPASKLGELAMEYDLEASALLALKMAADAYRTARPEAE